MTVSYCCFLFLFLYFPFFLFQFLLFFCYSFFFLSSFFLMEEDNVTEEDMEAYRLKRQHGDDPMKNFVGKD